MKTKVILLLIAVVWFLSLGFILLIAEPTPGGVFDSVVGLIVIKMAAVLNALLAVPAWFAIPEKQREAIISWIKLHF